MSKGTSHNWFILAGQKFFSLRPVSWVSARTFHHIDSLVYKLSDGRFTMLSLVGGLPVILLTTIGAKSGKQRTVPLTGITDGDRYAVIASNWGKKHFPAWYRNLKANPWVTVDQGGTSHAYIAREATPEEYERYWNRAVSLYSGYKEYKKRTGSRRIPVIVLEPLEEKDPA